MVPVDDGLDYPYKIDIEGLSISFQLMLIIIMSVYLNIGGTAFTTTNDTLNMIPYFQAMHRVTGELKTSGTEPYFIDRDPKIFRHVLNLARNPEYVYPAKYLSELSFYGFDVPESVYETSESRGIITTNNTSTYDSNAFDSTERNKQTPQDGYLNLRPEISVHRQVYRKISRNLFHPFVQYFDSDRWQHPIRSDSHYNHAIIVEDTVPLSTLEDFSVEIDLNGARWTYSLQAGIIMPNFITHGGFHHIPLPFLLGPCRNLITPVDMMVELVCPYRTKVTTGITYYESAIEEIERQKYLSTGMEMLMTEIIETSFFNTQKVDLSRGNIPVFFWKTDKPVDYVELYNGSHSSKITYSRTHFQVLEPVRKDFPTMPDNWGFICFTPDLIKRGRVPFEKLGRIGSVTGSKEYTMGTGLPIEVENVPDSCLRNMDCSCYLKFPVAVTGKLWCCPYSVLRAMNGMVTVAQVHG